MSENDGSGTRQLKSVSRAFDIVEYLRTEGPATLSAVAEEFDMPMSTAHIHLVTLVENDYVIKRDERYECSFLFLRTGGQLRDQLPLYQAAKTEIDDLRAQSGEIANVGTEQNGYMVQLYKSEGPESIDDNAALGAHLYLHNTALGKAMLSQFSDDRVETILNLRGLPALTEESIVDREALFEELEETRERGYAVNRGEHFVGVSAVAAPILSNSGSVVGAISISGPLSRMGDDRIEETLAPAILNKKNIIELKLSQR
ncbi:IclR family transcriptional regulator [Halogeometricum luteum]|uniref:IclR family transcriptional regulator n=1 Tax=Halogeometricum luteum TaxID=2950537 RepID=A0ABU2FYU1_9EURY|nr:IclR family transcriptional regulator [Halogeometricum sp. S3BR5-2]MDS0293692.1 IclR family transcriptional regulator [Halogeometricum sp. S3BR5-2]